MKWIKSRNLFLNEAKIRDVILPLQADQVKREWGEKYLDYEEVNPTDKIKQGTWKLSEDDKNKVLGEFMECDIVKLYGLFSTLPDNFVNILSKSIDTSLISNDKFKKLLEDFNIKSPTLDQILVLRQPVFRKIAVADTMASSIISKDENGVPIKDENNQMVKNDKAVGELSYTRNLINMNSFLLDYDSLINKFIELKIEGYSSDDLVSVTLFSSNNDFNNFISYASDEVNSEYSVDFEIFNRDIYLKISHNPQDILNMSISKFYSSCQHLYSGGYNHRVLGNVFDPNSIPAFLIFDTPIYRGENLLSKQLPLSRMIIRNIETFDISDETKLYFDRAYPDRMQDKFEEIVTKYSGNVSNYDGGTYYYTPDVDTDDNFKPYHDRLGVTNGLYIGRNIKSLKLTQIEDWSKVKVDPNSKIKELVIETTNLPPSLFSVKLNLDWVKFKFLTINDLSKFSNLNTDSYSFDKCKFTNDIISELPESVKKLQMVSCDLTTMDFSKLKGLEELHLIYSLDDIDDLKKSIEGVSVKKLVISGDLAGKQNKPFLNSLKSKGIKIEVVGPVI